MTYKKTIVCLANSRKLNGRCVAGLEFEGNRLGNWIRPVGIAPKGELYQERLYANGGDPRLLDLIEIELAGSRATAYHPEDHLIQAGTPWVQRGTLAKAELQSAVEPVAEAIWFNGDSSYYGENDRIPAAQAAGLRSSLKLIQPDELKMWLQIEGANFGSPRRVVRGRFSIGGFDYTLSVTDSVIEAEFASAAEGTEKRVSRPLLCLSVSEIFEKQNACFKLIAGVI